MFLSVLTVITKTVLVVRPGIATTCDAASSVKDTRNSTVLLRKLCHNTHSHTCNTDWLSVNMSVLVVCQNGTVVVRMQRRGVNP